MRTVIQTHSGLLVDPFNIKPSDIVFLDIVASLSKLCRFNGHTSKFYSVAQHSCIAAQCAYEVSQNKHIARWALLHDAAEAYIGDIPRPIKELIPSVKLIEANILRCVGERFDLGPYPEEQIKLIDEIMLATEKRDLLAPVDWPNQPSAAPMKQVITPWEDTQFIAEQMRRRWITLA